MFSPMYSISNWLSVLSDVVFQRWHTWHLGALNMIGSEVEGRVIMVTGPTSGLGKTTATELARRGAHVVLACRSVERGEELIAEWRREHKAEGRAPPSAETVQLDLSSLDSVRAMCRSWEASARPLHVLVANAGVFDMSGARTETKDGLESHFGCNYLGHFLLTLLLLPSLTRAGPGARVVLVSSKLHVFGSLNFSDLNLSQNYSALRAYAQSKLAQIMFGYELQRKVRLNDNQDLSVFSLHPGNVCTDVVRTLPGVIQYLYRRVVSAMLLTAPEGARASVHCATSPLSQMQGSAFQYYSSDCRPHASSRASYDEADAERLWKASLEMVGLPADII